MGLYRAFGKRAFDIASSAAGLVILSPVIALLVVAFYITNEGRPFFVQLRPGLRGKIFPLVKFKTMTDATDSAGRLLPDKHRTTRMGNFARATSLDELPQLFNVLAGHMSLIGPRPLLVDYLALYNDRQRKRHLVRPGITGWAQVNGRNAITWKTKFDLDVWYVDHISAALDIKILFMTLVKVFRNEGIDSSPHQTMERFNGHN